MISQRLPEGLYRAGYDDNTPVAQGVIPIHADLTRFVLINAPTSRFNFFRISQ